MNRKHVLIINLRKTLMLLYHYTIIKYELFFLFQKFEEQQKDYIDFYGDRDQDEPKFKH